MMMMIIISFSLSCIVTHFLNNFVSTKISLLFIIALTLFLFKNLILISNKGLYRTVPFKFGRWRSWSTDMNNVSVLMERCQRICTLSRTLHILQNCWSFHRHLFPLAGFNFNHLFYLLTHSENSTQNHQWNLLLSLLFPLWS